MSVLTLQLSKFTSKAFQCRSAFRTTLTRVPVWSKASKSAFASMASQPYTLYYVGTPNGKKASITIEELGYPYKLYKIDFSKAEQKEDWFLKINPNGRIPAIVDHEAGDFAVFESGAIMWYLAEKDPEGKLLPKDPKLRSEVLQWLMFQMGGLGPMMGQAFHFAKAAPEKIEYAINRYVTETERLVNTLETRLEGRQYLVGEQYTLADIASFPWCLGLEGLTGKQLDTWPNVKAWVDRINSRPAVQRALNL